MTTALQIAPTIIPVPAGSDLSTKQFYFMDITSGALAVAGAGTRVAGALCNDPNAAGKPGSLQIAGVAVVLAGGSISAGGGVASSAAGKAVAATGSAFVCGIAMFDVSDGEYAAVLLTGSSAVGLAAMSESVIAPGALNPAIPTTLLSVDGTDAFTMAAGTYVGQQKAIECVAAANTPLGTVTLADADGTEPLAWIFTAVGQRLEFEWRTGGWKLTRIVAAGTDAPTAATTVNPLVLQHVLTIADTLDWIIPSGVLPGQIQHFLVASTSGSPVGTVSGLFYDEDGSADGVDLNLNAAGDIGTVMWTGARWTPTFLVSATIS